MGWVALAGLVVAILGLTWPLVAFYDQGPRIIRFNCATNWNDATNPLSTGCSQNIINTPTGYTGHGSLIYYPTGLARIRPAGWLLELAWIAVLVVAFVVLLNLNRIRAARLAGKHVAAFRAEGYSGAAARALAARAAREEIAARKIKAAEERKKAENDRRTAEACHKPADAAGLARRIAAGSMALCTECGRNVEASQGVILTHGTPRCEGSGTRC